MGSDEFDFYVNVACANLDCYLRVVRLLSKRGVAETLHVDVHCEDDKVFRVLQRELGWDGSGETMPPLEKMLRTLASAFPPPFTPAQLFAKPPVFIGRDDSKFRHLLSRDARERKIDRIQAFVTLRSPEQMPISATSIQKFIDEFYLPQMLSAVRHQDFLPDDLLTTRELLASGSNVIRPEDRTFRLTFPCRDVTNAVAVADLALDGLLHPEMIGPTDAELHVLPIEIIEPAYLHLIAVALMYGCQPSQDYRILIQARPKC